MSTPPPPAESPDNRAGDTGAADSPTIDTRLVRKLAGILKETGLTEIEVERGDLKIRVAREITVAAAPLALAPAHAPAATHAHAAPAAEAAPQNGDVVPSPMVGTVYLQPQPGAEPFIHIGAQVTAGQTLLIVEAMKTMNPIPAPRAGRITEILVSDAQPVEFGEPLVVIE